MSEFEKYVASAEARKTTHGEHVDKLTGYFLAEANRMRTQQQKEQQPEETPEPQPEPLPAPPERVRWWQWWRRR